MYDSLQHDIMDTTCCVEGINEEYSGPDQTNHNISNT